MGDASSTWGAAFAGASLDGMKAYDRFVAPQLFEPYTADLIERLQPAEGIAALDVATGTGIVARALAARIGPTGRVTAADISPAMLAVAGEKPPVEGAAPITFVETPAAPLAVPDAAFDLVTCQQGMQFFPDRPAALTEMRRALRDGGRIAVAVWDPIETAPGFEALWRAVTEVLGDEIGARYPGPWSCGGDALADETRAAGFSSVTVEHVTLPLRYDSVEDLVDTLPASGIAADYIARGPEAREAMIEAVSRHAKHLLRDGALHFDASTSLIQAS